MPHLPQELWYEILKQCKPVEAECLRQTLRSLWQTEPPYTTDMSPEDEDMLGRRLRRDGYLKALRHARTGRKTMYKACYYCKESHHRSRFDQNTVNDHPVVRRCPASLRVLVVCSHSNTDYDTLRRTVQRNLTRPFFRRYRSIPCATVPIHGVRREYGQHLPLTQQMMIDGGEVSILNTYAVAKAVAGKPVNALDPIAALMKLNIPMCQHTMVNDIEVIFSFEGHPAATRLTDLKNEAPSYCEQCEGEGTKWWFSRDTAGEVGFEIVLLKTTRKLGKRFPRPQQRRWLEHSFAPEDLGRVAMARQWALEYDNALLML